MIVDSHCHLEFYTDEEKQRILQSCKDNNVKILNNICTTMGEAPSILKDTEKFKNVYASIGVHPCNVMESKTSIEELELYCHNPKVIGIGETGLDLYRTDNPPLNLQSESFIKHISVARSTGLPLVIHSRNADQEMYETLSREMKKGKFSGVLHCFTGATEFALQAVDLGFYISFSGILTFKKSNELQYLAKKINQEKILVETDAPFLSPEPYRGKRNEPSMIVHTVEYLAKLLNEPAEKIAAITTENFIKLFNKVAS